MRLSRMMARMWSGCPPALTEGIAFEFGPARGGLKRAQRSSVIRERLDVLAHACHSGTMLLIAPSPSSARRVAMARRRSHITWRRHSLVTSVDLGLAEYERMTIDHALRAGAQSAMLDPDTTEVRKIAESAASILPPKYRRCIRRFDIDRG